VDRPLWFIGAVSSVPNTLEINSDEEVDHASSVGRRREAEEGVFHGCVLCAEENRGKEVWA
jgi:hypothetical protein